jgi:hypothetical protein
VPVIWILSKQLTAWQTVIPLAAHVQTTWQEFCTRLRQESIGEAERVSHTQIIPREPSQNGHLLAGGKRMWSLHVLCSKKPDKLSSLNYSVGLCVNHELNFWGSWHIKREKLIIKNIKIFTIRIVYEYFGIYYISAHY